MIRAPGELALDLERGVHLVMRAEIGPYDRKNFAVGGSRKPPKTYRDVPGLHHEMADPTDPETEEDRFVYVNAELSDRAIGIGAIAQRTSLHLDPVEAAELSIEFDNEDGALNQAGQGAARFSLPHWWLRNNWHIGRLLRVRLGVRNRDKSWTYFPAYEGTIERASQTGRRISLSCLDPMKYLQSITITTNPTYAAKTAPEIIEDLFENTTGEPGDSDQTYARPILNYDDLDDGHAAAPFTLDVTGNFSSTLQGMTLAEAFANLALSNFGTVWIDSERRLRYTVRQVGSGALVPQFPIDWDRNLVESSCFLDMSKMINKVSVTYGESDSTSSHERESSIKRYYLQEGSFSLPFISSGTNADAWIFRFLSEFAFPPLAFRGTLDPSGLLLEPGDWTRVVHPAYGLDGVKFQLFEREFDPASKTVQVLCYSTDPQLVEGGVFQVGISTFYSADRFQ